MNWLFWVILNSGQPEGCPYKVLAVKDSGVGMGFYPSAFASLHLLGILPNLVLQQELNRSDQDKQRGH